MKNYECIGGPCHGSRVARDSSSFVTMLQPKLPTVGWHTIEELDELLTPEQVSYYLHTFIIDDCQTACWVFEGLTVADALGYIRVLESKAKYADYIN